MQIRKTIHLTFARRALRRTGLITLFFTLLCICTACGKTSSTRTPTIRPEDIPAELYDYKDITIIKQ